MRIDDNAGGWANLIDGLLAKAAEIQKATKWPSCAVHLVVIDSERETDRILMNVEESREEITAALLEGRRPLALEELPIGISRFIPVSVDPLSLDDEVILRSMITHAEVLSAPLENG